MSFMAVSFIKNGMSAIRPDSWFCKANTKPSRETGAGTIRDAGRVETMRDMVRNEPECASFTRAVCWNVQLGKA